MLVLEPRKEVQLDEVHVVFSQERRSQLGLQYLFPQTDKQQSEPGTDTQDKHRTVLEHFELPVAAADEEKEQGDTENL